MKVIILQENFKKATNIVAKLSNSSTQLPILGTVLISANEQGLSFSTTNLELSINYWVGAKVEKEGKVVIPIKQLLETVASLPKEKITLELVGKQLKLFCKGVEAVFNTLDSSEFPQIPSLGKMSQKAIKISFDKKDLLTCISKVSFSASSDESRAVLTGIMLESRENKLKAVATDGYRLSLYTFEKEVKGFGKEKKILLPARALNELSRVISDEEGDISLFLDEKENQAIFSFQNGEIVSRLIDGQFPDYVKIIPDGKAVSIKLDKQELERSVKLVSIFARESANIVRFLFSKGKLNIEANAAEMGRGRTNLDIDYQGEEIKIAFNFRFLNDLLKSVTSDELSINIENGLKPGVFLEKDNDNYLHLIMPVRVQENES